MNDPIGTLASFALTFLANGLWEALLLAFAAALVLRLSPSANATTRHAILVTALLAAIALPVLTTAVAFAPHPKPAAVSLVTAVPAIKPQRTTVNGTRPVREPVNVSAVTPAAPNLVLTRPVVARPQVTLPRLALLVLAGIWLLGALFFLARLAISLVHLERLKRDALPLPIAFRDQLERWGAIGRGRRDVRLCRSADISVPIAVGLFDAMILLPDRLLEDLAPEDLDRIVLHELAHLRRGDDWSNGFERLAEALLFFNPGVRWLVRQLDLEREVACDDWVLERRTDALPYAQCLVKLVEEISWPYRPVATAPGAFVTRRSISVRIERLLATRRDVRIRVSPAPLLAAGTVTLATCLLGAYVSPSIAGVCTLPLPADSTRHETRVLRFERIERAGPIRAARPVAAVAAPALPQRVASVSATPPATWSEKQDTVNALHEQARAEERMHVAEVSKPKPNPNPNPHPHAHANANSAAQAHRNWVSTATTSDARAASQALAAAGVAMGSSVAASAQHVVSVASSQSTSALQVAFDPASPSPQGRDYISELESVGYAHLSVDDLVRLKSVGVTADYIRGIEAAGFSHPSVETLVQLRAVGVTPDYVREIGAVGVNRPSLDTLVQLRAVGVTPAYVRDIHARFGNVALDELVGMRAVGVTSQYVADLQAAGVRGLTADSVKSMRAVGVDASYVHALAAAGYSHLTSDQLTQLRAVGVDEPFLKSVTAHGFKNVDIDELVRLKTSGIL